MGGTVALAIRKRGRIQTRLMPKYHGNLPALSTFATGDYRKDPGFTNDWKGGPKLPLAPRHYGLVVIDHDSKWCGSCSDYGSMHEGWFQLNRDYQVNDLARLIEQGRVESVNLVRNGGDVRLKLPKTGFQIKDIQAAVVKAGGEAEDSTLTAELSPAAGWTFEDYDPEDPKSWVAMMQAMDERGLGINTQDTLEAWDDFFSSKDLDTNPTDAWRARLVAQELEQATATSAKPGVRRSL